MSEIQWDVVCLFETRAADGNYIVRGGHRLFCGSDEFIYAGVAILVHSRWASSIIQFHKISDRLVFVDLLLHESKYRVIAIYVPHAGYQQIWFDECFDHLRTTVLEAQRKGMECMIGGDFNLEQHRGWRGDRFEEVLSELAVEVCNRSDSLILEERWTFRSVLGSKRVLDYCVASVGINVKSSRPINDLDLRSDHRAVQTCIHLPPESRPRRRHKRKRKIDWSTFPEVAKKVQYECINTLPVLEKLYVM